MPGLVPGIHADPRGEMPQKFALRRRVDGRDKPGHDDLKRHTLPDGCVFVDLAPL
jgi:hypothetical protein